MSENPNQIVDEQEEVTVRSSPELGSDLGLDDEDDDQIVRTSAQESAALARRLGLQFTAKIEVVEPPNKPVRGDFSRLIGSWGKRHKAMAIHANDSRILVAMSNPLDTEVIDVFRLCYGLPVEILVTTEEEVVRAINHSRTKLMSDRSNSLEAEDSDRDQLSGSLKIDVTDAEDEDAPIIRYVNTLIFRAATMGASDIHIEPFEQNLKVRFRIDGVLHDIDTEDKFFQASILSRVKVMSNLNIAEKRLPQDGRIGLKIAGQDVDIRVSTVPTSYGERIVMRLLDKSSIMLELPKLGFQASIDRDIRKNINKSHGIILVTGPTGSGKTTTLYACLSHINSVDKNILTIEDPVEYELEGVGQMQVNPKIDFTFANGLRAILRQDPDVIMVGEIRDIETVEIAIQASLTGHLVFSTLHTNDSPGAVTRLIDMGVEPFLISSSVLAIMAQRLVRRLCSHCKVPHQLSEAEIIELGLTPTEMTGEQVFRASPDGCEECQQNGYRGRMGIHELLRIDDAVRNMIMQRADATQIRAAAHGLKSLRYDGALKILQGLTSVEEVLRVTQEDIVD